MDSHTAQSYTETVDLGQEWGFNSELTRIFRKKIELFDRVPPDDEVNGGSFQNVYSDIKSVIPITTLIKECYTQQKYCVRFQTMIILT